MDIKTHDRLKKELQAELEQARKENNFTEVDGCRRALTTLREIRKTIKEGGDKC